MSTFKGALSKRKGEPFACGETLNLERSTLSFNTAHPMPAEARIAPLWSKQKLFVSLFFIAVGLWFWWDGLVGYPRKNERYKAWRQHEDGRSLGWPAYAQSKGWAVDEWPKYLREHNLTHKPPEVPLGPDKIIGQYVFGTITTLIGALLFFYWLTHRKRVLRSDEEAVYTSSGTRVPFEAIVGVGKKKWESKGIAKVRYVLEGRQREFVVDDYKFEMEPTRQILKEIEERLLARSGGASESPASPAERG